MKRSVHIQAELKELGASLLQEASNTMPYALPDGYFAVLADSTSLLSSLDTELEIPAEWNKKMPFTAPEAAYFEGLNAQIFGKINEAEAPQWSKNLPFEMPVGYFEHLPQQIIAKAKSQDQKVIIQPKRIPLFRTVQLAASMALVVFVGLGILQMNQASNSKKISLNGISNSEIAAYVEANIDDFDTDIILNGLSKPEVNKVSNEEISDYLSEEGLN